MKEKIMDIIKGIGWCALAIFLLVSVVWGAISIIRGAYNLANRWSSVAEEEGNVYSIEEDDPDTWTWTSRLRYGLFDWRLIEAIKTTQLPLVEKQHTHYLGEYEFFYDDCLSHLKEGVIWKDADGNQYYNGSKGGLLYISKQNLLLLWMDGELYSYSPRIYPASPMSKSTLECAVEDFEWDWGIPQEKNHNEPPVEFELGAKTKP